MSNNKLYTEEQLLNTIEAIRDYLKNYPEKFHESMIEKHLKNLTPIELPSDENIWEWWQTQKFQKEQGDQEYTMLYEIDLPKILKSFTEHLIQGGNNEQQ